MTIRLKVQPKFCHECGSKLDRYESPRFNIHTGEAEPDVYLRCKRWIKMMITSHSSFVLIRGHNPEENYWVNYV